MDASESSLPPKKRILKHRSVHDNDMQVRDFSIVGSESGTDSADTKIVLDRRFVALSEFISHCPQNPRTLRFVDQRIEELYVVSSCREVRTVMILILFLGFLFFSTAASSSSSVAGSWFAIEPIAYGFGSISAMVFFFLLLFKKFTERNYLRLHSTIYVLISAVFISVRLDIYSKLPPGDTLLVGLICTCIARGDYRRTKAITIFSYMITGILSLISNSALRFYRTFIYLCLGVILTVNVSKMLDRESRSVFSNQRAMRDYYLKAHATRLNSKAMLANVFPLPTIDEILRSMKTNLPCYATRNAEVICVCVTNSGRDPLYTPSSSGYAKVFNTVCTVFERHNIHRVKSCGLRILGVVGLFEQEVPCLIPAAVEVGIALRKQLKKSKITATISVARGPCKGGFINTTRKSFDLFGEAVDSCLSCSNACGPLEVCVDGPCMEHFLILRQIEISPLIARKNPRAGSEATWIIPCTAESEIAFCGHPIAEHDEDGENVAENVNIIGTEDEIEHSPLEASAHEEPKLGSSEDQQINDRIRELQGPAHWGWAIGNFSFPDNGLENEYSQYICSEQNLQIMRVLMGVLVANAILSGVVDFGFYYECGILVNILEHWFLLARYGLLFPILVVAVIPLWRSYGPLELMSTEHTYLWSTSHYACLTNMVYLLIRTNLVYGDSDFTKHMDLWDLVHFHYGETLFVAIMIVGLPHSGSSVVKLSFFVWLVMGLANINLYARNIQ
eukprot:TRINITY_DN1371_c0_g1_i27.p1 TRINITY_DN1371_c0_g1~~TRINITY_DN1371_c0_g1_i27.p1  ORF type:complete len:732 (-),score=60.56 TRINITY_DN1371_c0_g1_i27:1294-3489(-)